MACVNENADMSSRDLLGNHEMPTGDCIVVDDSAWLGEVKSVDAFDGVSGRHVSSSGAGLGVPRV